MTTVNIAFSGGVESVYLLQLALEKGFNVNLCLINVNNSLQTRMGEIIAMERIIRFFKDSTREGKDYLPRSEQRLKGEIKDIMHMPVCPFPARQSVHKSLVQFDVTQQFATALGMLMIRREYVDDFMPSVWIGWIKEDAAESSFNESDFSEDEYGALLKLPETIGSLSNADNIGVQFRAPLWNMTKREIYGKLIDEVKGMVIPNGAGHIMARSRVAVHIPFDHKLEEWKAAGIPFQTEYSFDIKEASWVARYCSGILLPEDVGLDDTHEVRELLGVVAPFFCKGRTLIRPQDVEAIRKDIARRVDDLIRSAQAMPKFVTEEDVQKLIKDSA